IGRASFDPPAPLAPYRTAGTRPPYRVRRASFLPNESRIDASSTASIFAHFAVGPHPHRLCLRSLWLPGCVCCAYPLSALTRGTQLSVLTRETQRLRLVPSQAPVSSNPLYKQR